MAGFGSKAGGGSGEDATARAGVQVNATDIATLSASQTAQDALIAAVPTQAQVDALQAVQDAEDPYSAFVRQADGSIDWTRESGATGTIAAPSRDEGVLADIGHAVEGIKSKLWAANDIKTIGDTMTNGFFRSITTDYDHSVVATNDVIGLKNDNSNGINVKLHDTGVDAVFSSILPGSVPSTQTGQTNFTLTPGACVALSRRTDGTVDVFYFGRAEVSKMRGDNGDLRVGQNLYFQDEAIGAVPALPQPGLYSEYSVGVIQCDAADWDGTQAVQWTLYATVESGGTLAWAKSDAPTGTIDVDNELVWSATETDIPLGAVRTVPGTPVMLLGRIVDDATADGGGSPDGSKWQDITAQTADGITSVDSDVSAPTFFGVYREDDKEYVVTGATDLNMLFPTAGPANDGWTATVYNNSTGTVTIGSTTIPAGGGAHIVSSANQQVVSAWGADLGETVEMGQSTFTYNSGGAIQGGASGRAYNTSNYSFTVEKDGEYHFSASCLQDITISGGGSTTPVGGQFYIGTTAGTSNVATLQMGSVKVGYDDDNRDNQDVQTVSDTVALSLTAGTYYYYMRTADPQSIAGSRQAHNLRGKLTWVGKATGEKFVKAADVIDVESDWTAVLSTPSGPFNADTWTNFGDPNPDMTGADGDKVLLQFGGGDRVEMTIVDGIGTGNRNTSTTMQCRIQAGGQLQILSKASNVGYGGAWVKPYDARVTMPDSLTLDAAVAENDTLALGPNNTIIKGTGGGSQSVNTRTFDFTSSFLNLAAETFAHGDVINLTNTTNQTGADGAGFGFNYITAIAINAGAMAVGESITILNNTGIAVQTDDPEQKSSSLIIPARSAVQLFASGGVGSSDFIPMRVSGNPNSN